LPISTFATRALLKRRIVELLRKTASGIMLTLMLIGMLTLGFNVQSSRGGEPIYVGTDNTVTMQQTLSIAPAVEWDKTYGAGGIGDAYSIVQTSDGGYALAGTSGAGASLFKTDAAGNVQWNQAVGTSMDTVNSMIQTSDGGYALVGCAYDVGNGDFLLVKTDASGNMQWNRTYGFGDSWETAYSVVQTIDGGYALAGSTDHFGPTDFWLVKTDAFGNMQWNTSYGGSGYSGDFGVSVVQTSDGGYALAGGTNSYGAGLEQFWLIKTDASGNAQWSKTYGALTRDEYAYSCIQTSDGGYALAGSTTYGGAENAWLVKTDTAGNLQWSDTFSYACASSVVQTSDGGYALAGFTTGSSGASFWFAKTYAGDGIVQWSRAYGAAYANSAYSVVQTSDGGYALAGGVEQWATGPDNFRLLKLTLFPPYNVTIDAYCNTEGADLNVSVLVDGSPNNYTTPCTLTGLTAAHTFTVPDTDPAGHLFRQWNTGQTTTTITATYAGIYIAYYGELPLPPITGWNKTYGGSANWKVSLVNTSDGGYALSSSSVLVKTDPAGNVIWNRTYGATGLSYPPIVWSLIGTSDGGYALAGDAGGGAASLLVKTDPGGNVMWARTYGELAAGGTYGGLLVVNVVVQTSDGGYALAGPGQDGRFWLVKTDASGMVEWDMNYGGIPGEWATSMVQTSDGGYALAGWTESFGSGYKDFWLVKTDASGNMQWNKTYGGTSYDSASSVIQTNDGGYALAGGSTSFGPDTSWLVKTDQSGNVVWNKTYGGSSTALSVIQTNEGGYATAGYTDSFGGGALLVKTDTSGNIQWSKMYGTMPALASSIMQTSDGGYTLAGTTSQSELWLIKVPPTVLIHDVAATNVASSKTVVGQGYSLDTTVAASDPGNYTETFNVTVYANTTIIASQNVTLSSGNSINVTSTWNTSGFAMGNYTISAYATPVLGETNTANNNCTDGWVIVSIAGDVTGPNGVPDGQVNLMDVYKVAMQFSTSAPTWDPYWGPVCDINNDATVNLIDYYRVCMNFGQTIP
jgi:hypothetical protein